MMKRWLKAVRRDARRLWFILEDCLNGLARRWLLHHDSDYQYKDAQYRLIEERNRLRQEGVGPEDPRYPSLTDFLDPKRKKARQ